MEREPALLTLIPVEPAPSESTTVQAAPSEAPQKPLITTISGLWKFGLSMYLVVVLLIALLSGKGAQLYHAASEWRSTTTILSTWPATTGTITTSTVNFYVEKEGDSTSTSIYQWLDVGYSFNLYSRSFTGSKLYGSDILENHDAQAAESAHRTGTAVKIYYDPFDPARSVAAPNLEYAARQLRAALWGLAWAAALPLAALLGIAGFVLAAGLGVAALESIQGSWRRRRGRTGPTPLPRETLPGTEPPPRLPTRPE